MRSSLKRSASGELKSRGSVVGSDVEAMSDEELKKAAVKNECFRKDVLPLQKSRVILALKSCGHTVGYLGDGIKPMRRLFALQT